MKTRLHESRAVQTILLVEDDPNDVFLVKQAFKRIGIHDNLQVVGNGQLAVAYLSGEGKFADRKQFPFPNLVITDFEMPVMDGLRLLQWMHSNCPRVPSVLLSSSDTPSIRTAAYKAGVCSCYTKPVFPEELVTLVKQIYEYWMDEPEEVWIPRARSFSSRARHLH